MTLSQSAFLAVLCAGAVLSAGCKSDTQGADASLAEPSSGSQTGPSSVPTWEEGERPTADRMFEDQDFDLEAKSARFCEKKTPLRPENGFSRLSVTVELVSKSARGVPVSPLLFTLEDKEGHRFRATLAGCAPSLSQQVLTLGQKLSAEVAFDVPSGSKDLQLHFEPFLVGRKNVLARVSVELPSATSAP